MNKKSSTTIFIYILVHWEWFLDDLIPYLRKEYGAKFIFVVPIRSRAERYKKWMSEDDVMYAEDEEIAAVDAENLEASPYEAARENERKYNFLYLMDAIQQIRTYGTYYLYEAPRAPQASMPPPPLIETTRELNNQIRWVEKILDFHQVDFIMKRPDKALVALDYVAKAKGIPATFIARARYKNHLTWSFGSLYNSSQLKEKWEALPMAEVPDNFDLGAPVTRHGESLFDSMLKKKSLLKKIGGSILSAADFFQHDLRHGKLFKPKTRLPARAEIAHHLSVYKTAHELDQIALKDVEVLSDQPFVLLLLQLSPELATNTMAKEFSDTSNVIRQLALALPSGYRLVVKEQVLSVGSRATDFYLEATRMPNVVFADPRISSEPLIRNAKLVSTFTGSVPIEAARYGVPSLIFAKHVEFDFLPSVSIADSLLGLAAQVKTILEDQSEERKQEFREAGFRYIEAVEQVSFDGVGTPMMKGKTGLPEDELTRAAELLLASIEDQRRLIHGAKRD